MTIEALKMQGDVPAAEMQKKILELLYQRDRYMTVQEIAHSQTQYWMYGDIRRVLHHLKALGMVKRVGVLGSSGRQKVYALMPSVRHDMAQKRQGVSWGAQKAEKAVSDAHSGPEGAIAPNPSQPSDQAGGA